MQQSFWAGKWAIAVSFGSGRLEFFSSNQRYPE